MLIFSMTRTVLEKRRMDRLVFLLTVSEMEVQFHYSVQSGQNVSITISTAGHMRKGHWTHLALQVGRVFILCYFC